MAAADDDIQSLGTIASTASTTARAIQQPGLDVE